MERRRGRTAGTPERNRPEMMAYKTLIVEQDDLGIVTITLNRPEKKNALSVTMTLELADALSDIADQREARVVVLTGAGDAFTSGADLTPDKDEPSFGGDVGNALLGMRRLGRLVVRLHELPQPTIA